MKWFKFIFFLQFILTMLSQSVSAQSLILQGKVTDSDTMEPLFCVNVIEIDESGRVKSGVLTNMDGNFSMKVSSLKNKIRFNYLGYEKLTVSILNGKTLNVKLRVSSMLLKEATVSSVKSFGEGGYKIPEREVAGAFQTLNSKEFENLQVNSVEDALQGRIAGMDIVSSSGDPGSGMSIKIRGTTSLNNNTSPLIVVNGIIYETDVTSFDFGTANQEQYATLLNVNPEDIEEITVLKDAAMTAVWGSRGANGVLMIKTKRGTIGKPSVSLNYKLSRSVQPQGLNMLNGDDYTMLMKQEYFNVNYSAGLGNINELNYRPTFSEYENFNNNTNWIDAVSQKSYTNNYSIALRGGGERAMYRMSALYKNQNGTVIGTKLDNFSILTALDYVVSSRIRFSTDVSYNYSNNDKSYSGSGVSGSILGIAYKKMPNLSIYAQDLQGNNTNEYYNINKNSSISDDQKGLPNPVALAYLAKNNVKDYRFTPTFKIQVDLLNPDKSYLRYNGYVQVDFNNSSNYSFLPKEVFNTEWFSSKVNNASNNESSSMNIQTEHQITWRPNFSNKNHILNINSKVYTRIANSSSQGENSYGLPQGITDPLVEARLSNVSSNFGNSRSVGFTSIANYSLNKRYIFNAVIRTDGSTRFGKGNRFGTFPSASTRWNIIDESFMDGTRSWLSMLALRGSYGTSGNQPGSDFLQYSRYGSSSTGYMGEPAVYPVNLQLTNLRWEKVRTYNIGLNLGFINDQITIEGEYYDKLTTDLLTSNFGITSTSGYSSINYINGGNMRNTGVEFNINARDIVKTNLLNVSVSLNISKNINVIEYLPAEVLLTKNRDFSFENGKYLERFQLNNPTGSIYGFRYKGVYTYSNYENGMKPYDAPVAFDAENNILADKNGHPKPMYFAFGKVNYKFQGGDAAYEDINHDGNINEYDIVYLGNINPILYGGLNIDISYKSPIGRISCRPFFNFRIGNKVVNMARMSAENMYSNSNQSIATNWRWRKDGDITDMPRALYQSGYNWLGSDRYVEDGSFCRFKYLAFAYSVPSNYIKGLGFESINLLFNINNLVSWTRYTGVDPEYDGYDNAQTPRSKDWTLGLSASF